MEIDMPKDARLYMTFPNDFTRHPKIRRLSVEARWAFVALNGEARIEDNDGVFDVVDATFMLAGEVSDAEAAIRELATSHPTRPLIVVDGDTLTIRDYAQHQQTRAERESLSSKRSAAGQRGRAKQIVTKSSDVVKIDDDVDQQFEMLWKDWPRKNDKATARRRWASLSATKRREIVDTLVAHARAHAQHTPTEFVPYLGTWLSQQRWDDPLPTARGGSNVPQSTKNAEVLARYASENGENS